MNKVIIFGNSGSGKSTLAKEYAAKFKLSHLDLDILAWEKTEPPMRKPLEASLIIINQFIGENSRWVVEGGYSDLLGLVINYADEIIFLNPSIETCIKNCRSRPWEPHKYTSADEQNENLNMLLDWVKEYPYRNDNFSLYSHKNLFDKYSREKIEYKSNDRK